MEKRRTSHRENKGCYEAVLDDTQTAEVMRQNNSNEDEKVGHHQMAEALAGHCKVWALTNEWISEWMNG